MNPLEKLGLAIAGSGMPVIAVGAAVFRHAPVTRDTAHSIGLLLMLTGAITFLAARRIGGLSDFGARLNKASSMKETARNLMLVGGLFVLGALATGVAFRLLFSAQSLVVWMLASVGLLGLFAFVAGLFGYGVAVLSGDATSDKSREHSA